MAQTRAPSHRQPSSKCIHRSRSAPLCRSRQSAASRAATLAPALSFQNAPGTGSGATLRVLRGGVRRRIVWDDDRCLVGEPTATRRDVVPGPLRCLQLGRACIWMVRGYDGISVGPWSMRRGFRTPASGNPGGGGGTATDFDSLGPVQIVGGSPDVRSWAVTSRITSMILAPGTCASITLDPVSGRRSTFAGARCRSPPCGSSSESVAGGDATGGERFGPGERDKELTCDLQ